MALLRKIIILLEPFELVTNLLSSDSQPTLPTVMSILKYLINNFISKDVQNKPHFLVKICIQTRI